MKFKKPWLLVGCIALCLAVGLIGSLFTITGVGSWYSHLARPSFSPPNWLFGPVWTLLYILMGISLYLVITAKKKNKQAAYYIFAVQLVLNLFWSILFFGMEMPLLAFIEILLLWVSILATIILFSRISRPAAWINLPYLCWVSFATLLNLAIYLLN